MADCPPDYAEAIQAVRGSLSKLGEIIVNAAEASEGWVSPEGWRTLAEVMEAPDANPGAEIDAEAISALMLISTASIARRGRGIPWR
jgi:hypothetical protein